MKILIVIDGLGAGGAEMSTALLCDHLYKKGVNFDVICLQKKDVGVQDLLIAKGYNIIFINHKNVLAQILYINRLIKKNKYDLVHSILFKSNLRVRFARVITRFLHIESLVNETYSEWRLADPRVNKTLLKMYQFIDMMTANYLVSHFHSITNAVKSHYSQKLRINPDKITVIYRGRKPLVKNSSSFKRSDLGIGENDFLMVCTGRQEFQKGQIYLLKAIDKLVTSSYRNIKLILLGRQGNVTNELERFVNKNNLNAYVVFAGHRSDVMSVLSSADLFVFPSLYEGLGGALIEAQAAGLPIACNNLDVLKEVVLEDKNAKIFSSQDLESICNAILFFINNPQKKHEFGAESIKNFLEKFQIEDVNEKMLDLYKYLIKNSKAK